MCNELLIYKEKLGENDKVISKVAIIGGGRVAAHHCKMIADVEKVELLAICDLKKQVGEPLAKIYEVPFLIITTRC